MGGQRLVFSGYIAGFGTGSGVRLVIGHWTRSPFGAFTDVMVQTAADERVLLAPSAEVAEFVADTYHFDRIDVGPVAAVMSGARLDVTAGELTVAVGVGGPAPLDRLLRLVPGGWPSRRGGSARSTPSPRGSCRASIPRVARGRGGASSTASGVPAASSRSAAPSAGATSPGWPHCCPRWALGSRRRRRTRRSSPSPRPSTRGQPAGSAGVDSWVSTAHNKPAACRA